MLDYHTIPSESWGIRPVLFELWGLKISAYAFFIMLGLLAGLWMYYHLAREQRKVSEHSFYILMAGLLGGILGAKVPIWIINLPLIIRSYPDIMPILSGRTIVGGLIGGTLSVMFIKWKLGIKEKKGNLFAPAIALGVAIGRIGCFLRGCCYGKPTQLPWGVDFGDSVLRHPTQLYESAFFIVMFSLLMMKRKNAKPGYLFYLLMNTYFIFRFLLEFIKEEQTYLGLTIFQYISIGALLFINAKYLNEKRKTVGYG
ncbi:MAG: prolipoprotein diacylglyceryl transferase [Nanoarchaeota archaeon]